MALWPNLLPDFSFSFAAISRRVPLPLPLPPSLSPSIVSCKWHVACGKLAGMRVWNCPRSGCWCGTFMSAHWKISVFSRFKIKSIIAKINYALLHAECSWQRSGRGWGGYREQWDQADSFTPAWGGHEGLLEASYCCFMQQHEKCIHHTTCFHSDIFQFCMWRSRWSPHSRGGIERVPRLTLAANHPNERVQNVRIAPVVFCFCCSSLVVVIDMICKKQELMLLMEPRAHSVIETGWGAATTPKLYMPQSYANQSTAKIKVYIPILYGIQKRYIYLCI